ncbi:hypothetical protein ACFJIW_22540 [Tahibacter sp. UC22_41]|uniref:hypothetical protein n=1 Tax=Tahibacter sp. UC22_41 TaxID=3350178 RepID=UPI0036DF6982
MERKAWLASSARPATAILRVLIRIPYSTKLTHDDGEAARACRVTDPDDRPAFSSKRTRRQSSTAKKILYSFAHSPLRSTGTAGQQRARARSAARSSHCHARRETTRNDFASRDDGYSLRIPVPSRHRTRRDRKSRPDRIGSLRRNRNDLPRGTR